jgi:hypothetical protein
MSKQFEVSTMASIDLDPVFVKLCHPSKGLGWDV